MRVRALGLSLAVLSIPGCDCTELGCGSALEVTVKTHATSVDAAEVVLEGSQPVRCQLGVVTPLCSSTRNSDGSLAFVFEIEPARMQLVRLYGSDGVLLAEKQALASIEINQPNGEECPPKCKQGKVSL